MEIRFIILFLFFGSSFLDMLYVYKEVPKSRIFSKTLLMPLLLLFYLLSTDSPIIFLIFALIFSFFGDLFLLWENKKITFILGLLSFLIAHLFFFLTFLITSNYFKGTPFYIYLFIIPYIIYGYYLYKFLKPEINKIKFAILIYILMIIIMSFSTIPRYYLVNFDKFIFPFLGSILFIVSDSLLALKVFKKKIKENSILIMLTYILAQFFIVLGFI
ncbi:MAG: lysoplasmalogenase family protein [Caldisericia bacterium]